jgi:serine/threonine-protein kinase
VNDQLDRLETALADRYAIERELGRGGMAEVYLARDLRHERPVALKVLRPELAESLGSERFLREIQIAAQLNHPHILSLFDSGEADGVLWYTMPFIEGESLRDRLNREQQLPIDDALQITKEVADGLGYAHSLGVVHRDIKPENILLSGGHALVADFGIARAVTEAGGDKLTQTGIVVGTPAYMSPEQGAGSGNVDARSDIYSLGCVLYEMLAGEPPYTGPTAPAIVAKKMSEPTPRISVVREAVPGPVEEALTKALSKTPADRYVTAEQFTTALAVDVRAYERRYTQKRLLRGAGIVSAAVVVIGAGTYGTMRYRAVTNATPLTAIAVLPFDNLSAEGANAHIAIGLHDELLTQLAKVAALSVRGRQSVIGYAGTDKPTDQIGEELSVGAIVQATVFTERNRLRVNVHLVDAANDESVWTDTYTETLDDAFSIQSDIAQQVVAAVGAALTQAEADLLVAEPTDNPEAYRLYLQGQEYRLRAGNDQQALEIAQEMYERAIALDPNFALAYAAVSRIHGLIYWYGYDRSPVRENAMRAAADSAQRLAPDLAETREAVIYVHYYGDLDYERALEEAQAAVEQTPGSAPLWRTVAYLHRRLGHWDEVFAAYEQAGALDPLYAMSSPGETYRILKRYEEAVEAFDWALDLAPDFHGARLRRAWTYAQWRGDLDSVRLVVQQVEGGFGDRGSHDRWRIRLAMFERQPEVMLEVLDATEEATLAARLAYEPVPLYAAWAYQVRGDAVAASRSFTEALMHLDSVLRERPDEWQIGVGRGLALAGLGRTAEALQEAERLLQSPEYVDRFTKPFIDENRAMIFAQLGMADEAVAELEPLITGPSWTSAHLVRLDPRYDPIRSDPRFQALLHQYLR